MLLIAVAMIGAAPAALTDKDLLRLSAAPFERAKKIGKREVLGVHHGNTVVAEYRCGDVCPAYTTRIIHYDLTAGPECSKHGGVIDDRWVPMTAAVGKQAFCVPAVLVERSKSP